MAGKVARQGWREGEKDAFLWMAAKRKIHMKIVWESEIETETKSTT